MEVFIMKKVYQLAEQLEGADCLTRCRLLEKIENLIDEMDEDVDYEINEDEGTITINGDVFYF
jgi:hypothetical protein